MDESGLFTAALGLSGPRRVTRTEFDPQRTQLDLYLDFARGARFACPAKYCAHGACEWRIVDHHVHAARDQLDCSGVRKVGVDENLRPQGPGLRELRGALVGAQRDLEI